MDTQKPGAGIIKEQGGSKCEDRGRISVEELTAQKRSKWGKKAWLWTRRTSQNKLTEVGNFEEGELGCHAVWGNQKGCFPEMALWKENP